MAPLLWYMKYMSLPIYHFWPSSSLSVWLQSFSQRVLCAFCLPFFNVFLLFIHSIINSFTILLQYSIGNLLPEVKNLSIVRSNLTFLHQLTSLTISIFWKLFYICLLGHISPFCISAMSQAGSWQETDGSLKLDNFRFLHRDYWQTFEQRRCGGQDSLLGLISVSVTTLRNVVQTKKGVAGTCRQSGCCWASQEMWPSVTGHVTVLRTHRMNVGKQKLWIQSSCFCFFSRASFSAGWTMLKAGGQGNHFMWFTQVASQDTEGEEEWIVNLKGHPTSVLKWSLFLRVNLDPPIFAFFKYCSDPCIFLASILVYTITSIWWWFSNLHSHYEHISWGQSHTFNYLKSISWIQLHKMWTHFLSI